MKNNHVCMFLLLLCLAGSVLAETETDTGAVAVVVAESTPALVGTPWRLVEVNGFAVDAAASGRDVYLVLQESENLFGGFGGCNRFGGSYDLADDRLTFQSIRSTKMACPETMELEARFMRALNQVATWKTSEQQLRFFAEDGTVLAVFESFTLPEE